MSEDIYQIMERTAEEADRAIRRTLGLPEDRKSDMQVFTGECFVIDGYKI